MSAPASATLPIARVVLRILIVLNWIVGACILGLLAFTFINVPWTTPPVIGHYLVTGGDWRAAVWGVVSLLLAMAVYYPFVRAAERERSKTREV